MKLNHVLFGAIIGAAAGVLLAPKKGKETVEDLKNYYNEYSTTLKNLSKEDVEKTFNETVSSVKKSIDEFDYEDAKDKAVKRYAEVKTKVSESPQFNKIKDNVTAKMESVKETVADFDLNAALEEFEGDTQEFPDAPEDYVVASAEVDTSVDDIYSGLKIDTEGADANYDDVLKEFAVETDDSTSMAEDLGGFKIQGADEFDDDLEDMKEDSEELRVDLKDLRD